MNYKTNPYLSGIHNCRRCSIFWLICSKLEERVLFIYSFASTAFHYISYVSLNIHILMSRKYIFLDMGAIYGKKEDIIFRWDRLTFCLEEDNYQHPIYNLDVLTKCSCGYNLVGSTRKQFCTNQCFNHMSSSRQILIRSYCTSSPTYPKSISFTFLFYLFYHSG